MAADEDHRPRTRAGVLEPRLIADRVQPRRDMPERCDERAVRRADAEVVPERRDPGEDAAHRVLADAAGRQRARVAVRDRVEEARGELLRPFVDARGAEEIGGSDEDGAGGELVEEADRLSELP